VGENLGGGRIMSADVLDCEPVSQPSALTGPQLPDMPLDVLRRAGSLLRVLRLAVDDMRSTDNYRVVLGFMSVTVFGRAVTNALQHLRSFDHYEEGAFDRWYEPWVAEMRADPLLRYFYKLRSAFLKDITPTIAVVLHAVGDGAPSVGAVSVPEVPTPTEHLGQSIEEESMVDLAERYVTYLARMVADVEPVVLGLQRRFEKELGRS
jgi:hypothetical protein